MPSPAMLRSGRLWAFLAALSAAALLAGCGSSSGSSHSAKGSASGHGQVNVLYAGSLENVMNKTIGPAFHRATGYTLTGYPAGSKDLASEIKGKVHQGDVFLSASPAVNQTLEGSANGGWVSWYAPFASTSLVLGYNPKSQFAAALKRTPWYEVISRPGFRLGYTDPKLDPKGTLAVAALKAAAAHHDAPALDKIAADTSDLFPEQDLVGRLQSGQLDAGLFYTVEASAAKIPTVSLGKPTESAQYTITVLAHAPHQAAANAFVKFLLGSRGAAMLRSAGMTVSSSPTVIGNGVPAALSQVLQAHR